MTPPPTATAPPTAPTVSFLSDYGHRDEFVGVVKSVIRSIAPTANIIDITHGIARHDIRAGGLALARAVQYLCDGVALAVVDPGVGSHRRGVAVELSERNLTLVGPDNGLLAPAVALMEGAGRAVSLTNTEFQLPAAGDTFDGRDVFGPAAAHLCQGVPLDELGEEVPVASLTPALIPVVQKFDDHLIAEVLWVDHFGNAQLNLGPEDLDDFGERFSLKVLGAVEDVPGSSANFAGSSNLANSLSPANGEPQVRIAGQPLAVASAPGPASAQGRNSEQQIRIPRARSWEVSKSSSYDQLENDEVGLVIDSYGMVSVAMRQKSASQELSLYEGMSVSLTPFSGDLVEFTPRSQAGASQGGASQGSSSPGDSPEPS